MNADQLGHIVEATLNALGKTSLLEKLTEFNSAFNNLINQSNEQHQKQFNEKRNELHTAIESEAFTNFPNTWRMPLEELGIYSLIGLRLREHINKIIDSNQLTPVLARDDIVNITERLTKYQTEFQKIREAFQFLDLKSKQPPPGEGVLSTLMPRRVYNDGDLKQFANEIEQFNNLIMWLSELVTGKTTTPKIKELATTEPWLLISAPVGVVLAILQIVEKIQNIRINSYKLGELRSHAESINAGQEITLPIATKIQNTVREQLDELLNWIFATYTSISKERINELKAGIGNKLEWLANRLDNGYQVDGDATEKMNDDAASDEEQKKYLQRVDQIKKISIKIKYVEAPVTSVLMLKSPNENNQNTKTSEDDTAEKPKKTKRNLPVLPRASKKN